MSLQVEVITTETRHYFEEALVSRLNRQNAYQNADTGCYTLRTLPLEGTHWGNGRADGYRSDTFLYAGEKRAHLWAIGELVINKLTDRDGSPSPSPSLKFRPLLPRDRAVVTHLLCALSSPTKGSCVVVLLLCR